MKKSELTSLPLFDFWSGLHRESTVDIESLFFRAFDTCKNYKFVTIKRFSNRQENYYNLFIIAVIKFPITYGFNSDRHYSLVEK